MLCGPQDSPWMVQKPSRLFVSAVCSSHRQRTPHHEPFGQIGGDGQAEQQQQPGWWDELIDDLMTDLKFIAPGPDAAPDQLVIHRACDYALAAPHGTGSCEAEAQGHAVHALHHRAQ